MRGKYLAIDTADGTFAPVALSDAVLERNLGGKGLTAHLAHF
jgi:hypothetical protein